MDLDYLEEFWKELSKETLGREIRVMTVTATEEMGREIKSISDGETVLFLLPPATRVKASDVGWRDVNQCLVFLLKKYIPSRMKAAAVLNVTQCDMTHLKEGLLERWMESGCDTATLLPDSIDIQPETELFGVFAGWSMAYRNES